MIVNSKLGYNFKKKKKKTETEHKHLTNKLRYVIRHSKEDFVLKKSIYTHKYKGDEVGKPFI